MSTAGDLITNAKDYADKAVTLAESKIIAYLDEIESLTDALTFLSSINVTTYGSIGGSISKLVRDLTGEYTVPTKDARIGNYNISSPPDFSGVDTTLLKNTVYEVINVIDTIPDRISEALIIIDAISGKVLGDLLTGGYGIDVNDELLLYERARDKELLLANDEIEAVRKQFAEYGLPIPPGAYNDLINKTLEKSFDKISNLNRDIYNKRAELFRAAREFAINKGLEIGKEQLGITDMKVKALGIAARSAYEVLSIEIENHKEKLARYTLELTSIFDSQKVLLQEYNSDIDLWKGKLVGMTEVAKLNYESAKYQLEADRLTLDQRIEKAKAQILAFNAEINARTAAINAVLQIYSQQVAGALSSITAVAAEITQNEG